MRPTRWRPCLLARPAALALLPFAFAFVAACGSSGGVPTGIDAAPPIDAHVGPDAPVIPVDAQPSMGVGHSCPNGNECPSGLSCLDETMGFPPDGFCTKGCGADTDCGGDAFCSAQLNGSPLSRVCVPRCQADGTCTDTHQVCTTHVGGGVALGAKGCLPGNPLATDGRACQTFGDCNREQACISNPFDFPGGYCATLGCTVGDDTTCAPGGDGHCIAPSGFGNTVCVDTCTTVMQCRAAEGYACDMLVPGDPTKICHYPHPDAGKACTTVAECSGAPWECLTGAKFPGGYCGATACTTANLNSCPQDAICAQLTPGLAGTETCLAKCTTDNDCRKAEGYKCLASNGATGAKVCKL